MNTTFIAMGVSFLLGFGLLVGLGALSLLSGALNFLFVKPSLILLKSQYGNEGFAFAFEWDQDAEPVKLDTLKVKLFNPFGNPKQIEITRNFEASSTDFSRDLEIGSKMKELLSTSTLDKATVEITVGGAHDQVFQTITMKGSEFKNKINDSHVTAAVQADKYKVEKEKPLFSIPEKTFISPPLPKTGKSLKLATNPEFAGQFQGTEGTSASASSVANFAVTKVWIEPGCIVCDACEGIFPEVFEVTDSTCIIRAGAPLDNGLKVQEAAEACPVEVIKFTKA